MFAIIRVNNFKSEILVHHVELSAKQFIVQGELLYFIFYLLFSFQFYLVNLCVILSILVHFTSVNIFNLKN